MSTKTELNKTIGRIFQIVCLQCKNTTRHKVLTSVDQSGEEEMQYGDWFYWYSFYQIVECQGCDDISFRKEHSNSEDYSGEDVDELIYPKRAKDTWATKDFFNIPYNLRRIYRETIDCYNNANLTLCGAGVRSLVEGLCMENGITDGEVEITKKDGTKEIKRLDNLQGKINGFYEKGKLTKEHAEILHEHRFLGNTSLHDLAEPTKVDLSLAIEIIEHVFDTIYEIPEKAIQLKHKRLKKKP